MAFGTAFACLSFFIIGTKTWRLGKKYGLITPSELIEKRTGSRTLRLIFAGIMLVFTLPYLALQIVGAGYLLEQITQGDIPYFMGACLLTLFTIIYVFLGGMSSVARTDLKQGILAFSVMFLAVIWISNNLGGLSAAHEKLLEIKSALFDREGIGNIYTPKKWFSWLIFWLFAIPMFPQIFMRFYVARDLSSLKKSAALYAFFPLIVSIFPVIIGVLGHLSFPELTGKASDQILPMMLIEHTPLWFGALVMTGALAAFMSTLDSQLLAMSTITTRDFILPFSQKIIPLKREVRLGKYLVVLFAMIGLAIAYQPFDTIFDMGKLAFSGLAVLFPACLFALHKPGIPKQFHISSIAVGEVILVAFYYDLIPIKYALGFEFFILAIASSMIIMLFGWLFIDKNQSGTSEVFA
jgi:SSS family solute:Na+ symporter